MEKTGSEGKGEKEKREAKERKEREAKGSVWKGRKTVVLS